MELVMMATEIETTQQAFDALPKGKRLKLEWTQQDKANWQATIDGETLPARVRSLDAKTFAAYRAGKYLGCEPTLELAQKRVVLGEQSQRNRVLAAWEKEHPLEIPPYLRFTDAERAEYWSHNPPAKAASGGQRLAPVPKAVGVQVPKPVNVVL